MKNKVALFACHDLIGLLMLNGIVPAMKAMGLRPVIYNTRTVHNKEFRVPTPPLVATMNVRMLEDIILPFMEWKEGTTLTYRQLAKKHGLEYHEIDDVNDPTFIRRISADTRMTGALSVRFLQVFGQDIINAFNAKGFMWNLHSGLLGDYKGLLLPYRAIANGEKEYGVTLHEIVPGIDDGGIIGTAALPLDAARPVMDLYMDTVETAVRLAVEGLGKVARGRPVAVTPQASAGHYYPNPTAAEFAAFVEKGVFYIDPATTIRRIADTFAGPDGGALCDAMTAFAEGHAPAARQKSQASS